MNIRLDPIAQRISEEFRNRDVTLRQLAKEFNMTVIKVKRILIETGDYTSPRIDTVRGLYEAGMLPEEIGSVLEMSEKAVKELLPYTKGIYESAPTDSNRSTKKLRSDIER